MTNKTATYEDAANAVNVIRQWYYNEVREIADDLRQAIKDGDIDDEDAAHDWLDQTVDGHEIVIYTFRARLALLASDNEDAYQDYTGEPQPSPEIATYYALRADVVEHLGDLSDLFDADPDDDEDA